MNHPYITIDQRKPVLIYKDRRGIYMVDENDTLSGLDITYVKNQKNQTAKVLASTYGEVKSKEHAEFIKLLAETNKIPCAVLSIDMNYTMFYVIDGCLFFCVKDIDAVGDYKKITIPLPPECEERKPKEVIANGKKHTLNSVTGFYDYGVIELGYATGSKLEKLQMADDYQVLSFVDECDVGKEDEWPKVNDEVVLDDDVGIVKLPADAQDYYIVEVNGLYKQCRFGELSKPKTPEQELNDELYLLLLNNCYSGSRAELAVKDLTDRYNITKKPQ